MKIDHMDLNELKGFDWFSDIPHGALIQFGDDTSTHAGLKTSIENDSACVLLIGDHTSGVLLDATASALARGPFIDVDDIAKIVAVDPGFAPAPALSSAPIPGCLYKSTSLEHVFYIYGTMFFQDKTFKHHWICVESTDAKIKRGNSTHGLRMDLLLPITTRPEVRRRDWRN